MTLLFLEATTDIVGTEVAGKIFEQFAPLHANAPKSAEIALAQPIPPI